MSGARKLFAVILFVTFALCLAANIYIQLSYAGNMPAAPEADKGRTYSVVVNHGYIRYVTKNELERMYFVKKLFYVGLACLAGSLALKADWGDNLYIKPRSGTR